MNALPSTASSPRSTSRILSSILFVVAALVLAAGISYFTYDKVSGGGNAASAQSPAAAPQGLPTGVPSKTPALSHLKYSQLSPQVHAVVKKFVLTAVARKNIGQSWAITAPAERQGLTKRQWESGNIPPTYYPVYHFNTSNFTVRGRTARELTIRMGLRANPSAHLHPTTFDIGLHKFGSGAAARWKVDYFQPFYTPGVPYAGQ